MNRSSRIYVAGGATLIGAALLERLRAGGYDHVVGAPPDEPDLTVAGQVEDFFAEARPEYVFVAAGESGGILANRSCPADLMLDNLLVASHVVQAARDHGILKLLYLASSCSYPRHAAQPLRVESLLTGPLEPTSEAYAMAKLAGLRLCQAYRQQYGAHFITAIPANPFGPHDDFSLDNGHVIPALIRKLHDARLHGHREVAVWGTGRPRREFIYSGDLADACLFIMNHYDQPLPINLGGGVDFSIAELARMIADVVGFDRRLWFDTSKPDGMALKALDSSALNALGWRPMTPFRTALHETYAWYQEHIRQEDRIDVPASV
jgi:GDP-L-fucose synthase